LALIRITHKMTKVHKPTSFGDPLAHQRRLPKPGRRRDQRQFALEAGIQA
jgi:hypothetical protein